MYMHNIRKLYIGSAYFRVKAAIVERVYLGTTDRGEKMGSRGERERKKGSYEVKAAVRGETK